MGVCRIYQRWPTFLGACDVWCSQAFARGVQGMLPPNFFLNGAIWCVLEHIFINFSLSKSLKIFIFYTKIMINCSHVLARRSRSVIHCPPGACPGGQWRSEGGGAVAPGRRPEGGAKILPKNF